MTGSIKCGARGATLILLLTTAAGVIPPRAASAQGRPRLDIWDAGYLRETLKRKEAGREPFDKRLADVEEHETLAGKLVQLHEEQRDRAKERLAEARADDDPFEGELDAAEEDAELAEFELKAMRKALQAATSYRTAAVAREAELDAEVAAIRLKLNVLDDPVRSAWGSLYEAERKHARAHLKTARAEQALAEHELEEAEAKVAALRKKAAVAKRRVVKARDELENLRPVGDDAKAGA